MSAFALPPKPKAISNRPAPACPKCGYGYGFTWAAPNYHEGPDSDWTHSITEHLDWHCESCGFRIETPTADAEVA